METLPKQNTESQKIVFFLGYGLFFPGIDVNFSTTGLANRVSIASAPGATFAQVAIKGLACSALRSQGIGAERGIAWRLADSLALRRFVGIALDEYTPDHSTISRTRRLIDLDTHREVFGWVLGVLADRGLVQGQRIAIDATTLEANAAMRSIVRRDTGESYDEFLTGLAKASGIETPTREDMVRLDRKRKKRTSNQDWKSPADGDARITSTAVSARIIYTSVAMCLSGSCWRVFGTASLIIPQSKKSCPRYSDRSARPGRLNRGLEKAQTQVEVEMNNLADAIGRSGGSAFLLKALQAKEADHNAILASLACCSPRAMDSVDPDWIRTTIRAELADLGSLLNMDAPRAKAELHKHVTEIRMTPSQSDGERFYLAEGKWDIAGLNESGPQLQDGKEGQYFPMVAGAGFEPATFGL